MPRVRARVEEILAQQLLFHTSISRIQTCELDGECDKQTSWHKPTDFILHLIFIRHVLSTKLVNDTYFAAQAGDCIPRRVVLLRNVDSHGSRAEIVG